MGFLQVFAEYSCDEGTMTMPLTDKRFRTNDKYTMPPDPIICDVSDGNTSSSSSSRSSTRSNPSSPYTLPGGANDHNSSDDESAFAPRIAQVASKSTQLYTEKETPTNVGEGASAASEPKNTNVISTMLEKRVLIFAWHDALDGRGGTHRRLRRLPLLPSSLPVD
jgi:hypothetical protein